MIYRIVTNTLTGCLCAEALAGTQRATLGCVWPSPETYNCQVDCDGCSLGGVNATATYLGKDAYASNCSTAIGSGSVACCNGIAINGTATDTDAIAIGTTAAADTVAIGNKVVVDTNAVIVGKLATGLSCSVSIGANASAQCGVAIGICSVSCAQGVSIGPNSRASNGISIGSGSGMLTSGSQAILIGDASNGDCCAISIGVSSSSCENGVSIGSYAATDAEAISIGKCAAAYGCYSIAIGSEAMTDEDGGIAIGCLAHAEYANTIAIGPGVDADTDCVGDTFIGSGSNVFKFCGETGYTYGNGCMMTGRILNSAAELPASNCELLLYFVS